MNSQLVLTLIPRSGVITVILQRRNAELRDDILWSGVSWLVIHLSDFLHCFLLPLFLFFLPPYFPFSFLNFFFPFFFPFLLPFIFLPSFLSLSFSPFVLPFFFFFFPSLFSSTLWQICTVFLPRSRHSYSPGCYGLIGSLGVFWILM